MTLASRMSELDVLFLKVIPEVPSVKVLRSVSPPIKRVSVPVSETDIPDQDVAAPKCKGASAVPHAEDESHFTMSPAPGKTPPVQTPVVLRSPRAPFLMIFLANAEDAPRAITREQRR